VISINSFQSGILMYLFNRFLAGIAEAGEIACDWKSDAAVH
jgi:hypothetical protein